jgi:hypothetical protein
MEKTIDAMNKIKNEYIGKREYPYLVGYSKTHLPIHVSRFTDLGLSKDIDRKKDQWRGFPYTSKKWPWPTREGLHNTRRSVS